MYRIYADDVLLHNPLFAEKGRVVISPVLTEKLNTHGSLQFGIAPSNPLYDAIEPKITKIKVVSDANVNNKPWFGRVVSVDVGWNNIKDVYCEGALAYLCDSIMRPFGYKGSPADMLDGLLANYRGSHTSGPQFLLGNVSVVDPNDTIVRSSSDPMSVWDVIDQDLFNSSLGGYVLPRYDAENDRHYVDYLSLDDGDQYAHVSSQIVKFGKNLLSFTEHESAVDIITVLIPYGALLEPDDPDYEDGPPKPESGFEAWDGNRITIESVNDGKRWIEDTDASEKWGRTVGTYTWENVTVPANLLTKARAYLAQQIWQSVTLEMSAVDLSYVNADIEQIQVGDYVRCESVPHDLNVLMLCTQKTTYLTELESSGIVLGVGLKTITDLQKGGAT